MIVATGHSKTNQRISGPARISHILLIAVSVAFFCSSCISMVFYSIGAVVTAPLRPPFVDCINEPDRYAWKKSDQWRQEENDSANAVNNVITAIGIVADGSLAIAGIVVGAIEGRGELLAAGLVYAMILPDGGPDYLKGPTLGNGPDWRYDPSAPRKGTYHYTTEGGCKGEPQYEYITMEMGPIPDELLVRNSYPERKECESRYRQAAFYKLKKLRPDYSPARVTIHELATGCYFVEGNDCHCRIAFRFKDVDSKGVDPNSDKK
ncbi:MAG: hypothetical protein KDK25_06920 [Leptospiraceae bacterium]|nr:hypothetical protein [Leptospiraceae bacterium]